MDHNRTHSNTKTEATIVPFPRGHEAPETTDVEVDGQQVTIIYLPWNHEVDGQERPAGVYYRAPDGTGFFPAPDRPDLDSLLQEMLPTLQRHLHVVGSDDPPAST